MLIHRKIIVISTILKVQSGIILFYFLKIFFWISLNINQDSFFSLNNCENISSTSTQYLLNYHYLNEHASLVLIRSMKSRKCRLLISRNYPIIFCSLYRHMKNTLQSLLRFTVNSLGDFIFFILVIIFLNNLSFYGKIKS